MKKFILSLILTERPRTVGRLKARFDGEEDEKILCVRNPVVNSTDFLNRTAAEVFQLCDGEHTIAQIVEALHKKYKLEISRDEFAGTIIKCIRFLEARGLLYKRKYGRYRLIKQAQSI